MSLLKKHIATYQLEIQFIIKMVPNKNHLN